MNSQPATTQDDVRWAERPLVSVVINNFNYGRYLGDAIDSALNQSYVRKEVVVVDDGSTDHSRDIIARYGSKICSIVKTNGGQASALNAGFAAIRGDIVLFLDADDFLLPTAFTSAVAAFGGPTVSNVRWPMWIVDAHGIKTGGTKPSEPPTEGDFSKRLLECGPSNLPCCPTSGNAWSRNFLQDVFPIPEDVFRLCADDYLYTLAPAFGQVRTIQVPQSCYRIHGENNYSARSFREKLQIELTNYDRQCEALSATLGRSGIQVDLRTWKRHSWFHRLERAVSNIIESRPEHSELVLIDAGTWDAAGAFGKRSIRPFFEQYGDDWGPPTNSQAAIAQLDAIRSAYIDYIVIGWPSFWWFDEYPGFFECLAACATCVLENDDVIIYRLAPKVMRATAREVCGEHSVQ